jgi:hypothetical protein
LRTQTIWAQLLQSDGTREQISDLLHDGHVGFTFSGHVTQRLKTVRRVRSTSDLRLTERLVMGVEEVMAVRGVEEPRASRARSGGYVGGKNEKGIRPSVCRLQS